MIGIYVVILFELLDDAADVVKGCLVIAVVQQQDNIRLFIEIEGFYSAPYVLFRVNLPETQIKFNLLQIVDRRIHANWTWLLSAIEVFDL